MKMLKRLGTLAAASTLGAAIALSAQAEEVNIGFTGPLSGGAALYGENTLSGLRMAAEEINANGGFKVDGTNYTVNVIALDDRYSPSQAATNAKRLKQESKVPAVFVPHSGGIFALMSFNEQSDFLVMAYSSVPSITEKGNELTLRIPPTFDGYVEAFTKLAYDEYGKGLALGGATHEYAKIWSDMIKEEWKSLGGEIVADNPMDYNKSADFYTGVSRLISENPDVMFIGGASEPTGLVARQARELGYQGPFILMDQAKLDEVAEVSGGLESLEGSIGVVPLTTYTTDSAQQFVKRYNEEYGKNPGSEAAFMYGAMHGLVHAMEIAGTVTDPKAIRAAMDESLSTIDDSKNPYEVNGVNERGGFLTEPTVAIVKDGKIEEREMAEILDK